MEKFTQIVSVILLFMSVILIPIFVLMLRGISKWTRVEMKLDSAVTDIKELVENKDKTHAAMLDQMRVDRDATDRRLRYLEENLWSQRAIRNQSQR